MKGISVDVGAIAGQQPVRIVGVQLASPIASGELVNPHNDRRVGLGRWARDDRIERVRAMLPELLKLAHGATTIIAFPEYSLSKLTHKEIDFAALATEHQCVLIPGSYWEESSRRNVCKIYLPDQSADRSTPRAPVAIAKLDPTRWESQHVDPALDDANVAQLRWTSPDGRIASISVFLCRDYLAAKRELCPDGETSGLVCDVTETHFRSEGLNLALMHTDEVKLFESAGSFDLRGLRGKRRLAMYLNCSDTGAARGTALLGVKENNDKADGSDIVKAVSPRREGVLVADVRLQDLRPEKAALGEGGGLVDAPVWSVTTWDLREDGTIEPPKPQLDEMPAQKFRAVWRPAFLEAVEMAITIEFYLLKRISKAMTLFANGAVKDVYAGIVRGEHDLSVRRYVHTHDVPGAESVDFRRHCTKEVQDKLEVALDHSRPPLRLFIHPRDILKYRGMRTNDASAYAHDLEAAKRGVKFGRGLKDLVARADLVKEVLRLAEGVEQKIELPKMVKPYMYAEFEEDIPLGEKWDTRETYVFLWLEADDLQRAVKHFEEQIICGRVMQDSIVREIFRLKQAADVPSFLLKLKCNSWQADRLVNELRIDAETLDIDLSTRTVDISVHLSKSSLRGLLETNKGVHARDFIKEFRIQFPREEDGDLWLQCQQRNDDNGAILSTIADLWAETDRAAPNRIPQTLRSDIFTFWGNLLLNFANGPASAPNRFVKDANAAWGNCYQALEQALDASVVTLYERGCFGDRPTTGSVTDNDLKDAIRKFVWPDIPDADWRMKKDDAAQAFYGVTKRLSLRESMRIALREDASRFEPLRRMRNMTMHLHGGHLKARLESMDLTGANWKERVQVLADSFLAIIGLMDRAMEVAEMANAGDI